MQLNSNGWHVDDHIVVAVSTGIDSMCLLYQLLNDYKDSYRKLTCLHVNHGVRSASIEEARFLEAYCERHHIDLHIKKLDLSHSLDRNNSIQNEARIKRYEWFDVNDECIRSGCIANGASFGRSIRNYYVSYF